MNHFRELDRLQCTAKTKDGHRCHRIGHYGVGGGVLCTEHHRIAMVKKFNDKPIRREPCVKPVSPSAST